MSVLDRIAREYVDLVLTKHQHHDVWDVYWLADTIFWKREDMHVDRVNRHYPYKPAPAKSYMSLADIVYCGKLLLKEVEEQKKLLAGRELIRAVFLAEHLRSLIVKAKLLQGEKMPYDVFTEEMYALTAPPFSGSDLKKACDDLSAALPGTGSLIERIGAYKRALLIPCQKLPAVMDYAARFFHEMAVENMGIKNECMPRIRYWHYGNDIDFVTVLFGYDYDLISLEQNFNLDVPYYLDNIREVAGHELEPGHFTFMNLRTKGAIDYGYPELGLNLHAPSSAFIEAGARLTIELALDTPAKERVLDEKLFELAGADKKYLESLPVYRSFTKQANLGKLEIERKLWNGEWTDAQAREFAAEYAIDYDDVLRFAKDAGHFTSHSYSTDVLRRYYDKYGRSTEEKWKIYTLLCQQPFSMKGIEDGSFDPFAFDARL